MAEIVEYRVEKTLDELKLLVDFGILDENHVKDIVSKREKFEYDLRRRTKSKLEFTKYIKFEMNLLNSIENYRKTVLKSKPQKGQDEIERKILLLQAKKLRDVIRSRSAHIGFLFRKLTTTFQFDKRLWLAYIEFAKQRKWNTRVSALYWRLLRVSGDDEDIWVEAAAHEADVNKAFDAARSLYLRGLRHKPKSKKIAAGLKKLLEESGATVPKELTDICDAPTISQDQESETVEKPTTSDKSNMDRLYECYEAKGIDETRKLYEELEKCVKSQTLSLYVGMIQVELWGLANDQSEARLNRIRAIYDKALVKFGKRKAKLWYEYIQFEHEHAKSLEDCDRINRIYTRALTSLHPSQVNRVIEKYTLLQTNPPKTDIDYSDYSDLES